MFHQLSKENSQFDEEKNSSHSDELQRGTIDIFEINFQIPFFISSKINKKKRTTTVLLVIRNVSSNRGIFFIFQEILAKHFEMVNKMP
jgi:3'-phosphoadenosine 5'-phosphosulfate sulfotransferase (PAPS reductase)/FAD synthetase